MQRESVNLYLIYYGVGEISRSANCTLWPAVIRPKNRYGSLFVPFTLFLIGGTWHRSCKCGLYQRRQRHVRGSIVAESDWMEGAIFTYHVWSFSLYHLQTSLITPLWTVTVHGRRSYGHRITTPEYMQPGHIRKTISDNNDVLSPDIY